MKAIETMGAVQITMNSRKVGEKACLISSCCPVISGRRKAPIRLTVRLAPMTHCLRPL